MAQYINEFLEAMDEYTYEMRLFYSLRNIDEPPTEAEREVVRLAKLKVLQIFVRVLDEKLKNRN
jgi:hypothetical protein